MKKIFLEPEIMRIDIKMTENIAMSGPVRTYFAGEGNTNLRLYTSQYDGPCYVFLFNTSHTPFGQPLQNVEAIDVVRAYGTNCIELL